MLHKLIHVRLPFMSVYKTAKPLDEVILIADTDKSLRVSIAQFLKKQGYKTVTADTYDKITAACKKHRPQLVIADVGITECEGFTALSMKDTPPILLLTSNGSEKEMVRIVETCNKGVNDFLIKPFPFEILHEKIRRVLNLPGADPQKQLTHKLSQLHRFGLEITATDSFENILDTVLNSCLKAANADYGYLDLVDTSKNKLVRARTVKTGTGNGITVGESHSGSTNPAQWVFHHNKSLHLSETDQNSKKSVSDEISSVISVPLKVAQEIIGVLTLYRNKPQPRFSCLDINTIEIFALQAASAMRSINRYDSLTRKLEELSLISAYSEKLMGLVEKKDIIKCLFETVRNHFPFDMVGFLVVKRRFHQFLYWARKKVPNGKIVEITADVVEKYNRQTKQKLVVKRVSPRLFVSPDTTNEHLDGLFEFSRILPVTWEDYNFGAAFFASHERIEEESGVISFLTSLMSQTRIALTNARLYNDMKENYIRTIKALAIAVDAKDTYTHGHSENVMNIAESIARELSSDEKWIGAIRDAGLLHDIGKIGIPGYILNKPGPLTYEEFNGIMKTHTTLGANIVKDVPFLQELYSLILYHHEHYDGSGYPEGLVGENIPLGARILHVSDAFEAMTSNRPYRDSLGKKEAFKRLHEQKGKQFDPRIVEIFESVAEKKGWIE